MNLGKLFAATAIAALATTAAHAGTFNFVDEAANDERGEANGNVVSFPDGDLTFFATKNGQDAFAYFDDLSSGRPGGLGVCGSLIRSGGLAGECDPSNDDNVTEGETIRINFDLLPGGTFDLRKISFNGTINGVQHLNLDNFGGMLRILTSSGFDQVLSFATAASTSFGAIEWIEFQFVDTQFYIASISDVPLPGALPLLLSGVAGLGFASRRRKTA